MSILPEIELKEWQSAEPHRCGSCHYFNRSGGVGGDWCSLRFPEWVAVRNDPDRENQYSMSDTATCDFWSPRKINNQVVIFTKCIKWTADGKTGNHK